MRNITPTALVVVWHNADAHFMPAEAGQRLTNVHEFTVETPAFDTPEDLCEAVFAWAQNGCGPTSIPGSDVPPHEVYPGEDRPAHRSLSVGDVVTIGEVSYCVESFGFRECSIRWNAAGDTVEVASPTEAERILEDLEQYRESLDRQLAIPAADRSPGLVENLEFMLDRRAARLDELAEQAGR